MVDFRSLVDTYEQITESASNLKSDVYYKVVKPFDVWILYAQKPSNASFGSSRIYEPVYKKVKADVGSIVANLVGGTFYINTKSSIMYEFTTSEPKFSAFTRNDDYVKVDLSKVEELPGRVNLSMFNRHKPKTM